MTADDEGRDALLATAMDWALGERIGGEVPPDLHERVQARLAAMPSRSETRRSPWLLAAAALFGIGVVAAVAVLARPEPKQQAQDPVKDTTPQPRDPVMVSAAKEIEALPADTKTLICLGIGDDAFPALLRLQVLESLEFAAAKPARNRLVTIAKIPTITDSALARLAELPSLRSLQLTRQSSLTKRGMDGLANIAGLTAMAVSGWDGDDDALAVLSKLTHLERLKLNFCRGIGKPTIERIGAIATLRFLDLGENVQLQPEDLVPLGGMKDLVELHLVTRADAIDLQSTNDRVVPSSVTDGALTAFAGMRSLRLLELGCSNASEEAIRTLQRQIPGLVVQSTPLFFPAPRTVSSRAEIEALPADTTSVIGIGIEDDEVPALLRLSSLQRLELRAVMPSPMTPGKPVVPIHTIGDDGLILLTSLRSLRTLHLQNQGTLTKRGYDALATFPALSELTIDFCGAGDDDLTFLSKLPKLESLALHNFWNIHRPTIARIAAMRSLRSLDLGTNGQLEMAWLKPLAAMTELRELRLASVGFTNIDIEGATQGRPATIRYTSAVTDELIDTFAAMSSLSSLDLSYSNLTPAGKARLQVLLPNTTVVDTTPSTGR